MKSPNSASKSDEAEEGTEEAAAVGTIALTGAGLPIRPRRSAEAEVGAGTLLVWGAVTGRDGSVLATVGLQFKCSTTAPPTRMGNLLVTGAVGLLAGRTTFLATSALARLRLLAASSPRSNPI